MIYTRSVNDFIGFISLLVLVSPCWKANDALLWCWSLFLSTFLISWYTLPNMQEITKFRKQWNWGKDEIPHCVKKKKKRMRSPCYKASWKNLVKGAFCDYYWLKNFQRHYLDQKKKRFSKTTTIYWLFMWCASPSMSFLISNGLFLDKRRFGSIKWAFGCVYMKSTCWMVQLITHDWFI